MFPNDDSRPMLDPTITSDANEYLASGDPHFLGDRLAITGASGMLGSYLLEFSLNVAWLTGNQIKVLAFSRSENSQINRLLQEFPSQLTVAGYGNIRQTLRDFNPMTVVHAASPASPENYSNVMGLIETNILMTSQILAALANTDSSLIFLSSGEVYGFDPPIPVREDCYSGFDHLSPRGAYPAAKQAAELLLSADPHARGRKTALRVHHTFGPGVNLTQSRIFSSVITSILEGRDVRLRTDGSTRRSFLYALDFARALPLVAKVDGFSVFNIAGASALTMLDFAREAICLADPHLRIIVDESDSMPEALLAPVRTSMASTEKIGRLGWAQTVSLERGLERTLQSARWRLQIR